jgi:hypothetical protein
MAALDADEKIGQRAWFASDSRRHMDELDKTADAALLHGEHILVRLSERDTLHCFVGLGDPADDEVRHRGINADNENRCHVGIARQADELLDMDRKIGLDLAAAIARRHEDDPRHPARDALGHAHRQAVDAKNQNVVPHASGTIAAPVEEQGTLVHG